jgi:hypothetical protein
MISKETTYKTPRPFHTDDSTPLRGIQASWRSWTEFTPASCQTLSSLFSTVTSEWRQRVDERQLSLSAAVEVDFAPDRPVRPQCRRFFAHFVLGGKAAQLQPHHHLHQSALTPHP